MGRAIAPLGLVMEDQSGGEPTKHLSGLGVEGGSLPLGTRTPLLKGGPRGFSRYPGVAGEGALRRGASPAGGARGRSPTPREDEQGELNCCDAHAHKRSLRARYLLCRAFN